MTWWQKLLLVAVAMIWLAAMGSGVAFISAHGRFPMGGGEVANWLFGLNEKERN